MKLRWGASLLVFILVSPLPVLACKRPIYIEEAGSPDVFFSGLCTRLDQNFPPFLLGPTALDPWTNLITLLSTAQLMINTVFCLFWPFD